MQAPRFVNHECIKSKIEPSFMLLSCGINYIISSQYVNWLLGDFFRFLKMLQTYSVKKKSVINGNVVLRREIAAALLATLVYKYSPEDERYL